MTAATPFESTVEPKVMSTRRLFGTSKQCYSRKTVRSFYVHILICSVLLLMGNVERSQAFVATPFPVSSSHHSTSSNNNGLCSKTNTHKLLQSTAQQQQRSRLFMGGNDETNDPWAMNKARTDIRNFLTQRALQSFIFLLINCRDEATVRWIENTYEFQNLERFHGTGALNMTLYPAWDNILVDMMARPATVIIIRSKRRGRGHGGWSKNNPFLEERFVEFEIDIKPASLVSRIVAVREQIAGEWVADLQTLRDVNEMILDSYYKTQDDERNTEKTKATDGEEDETEGTGIDNPESYEDKIKANAEKKAYDRGAMMVLGNHIVSDGKMSSPYRKGTFDLLGLLATQESIHRLLRNYRNAGDEREVSYLWLREFYVSRVASHFDGSQDYGRADDFLGELLLTAPSMKQFGDAMGLIDPLRIAEDIIAMRSEVMKEWRDTITDVLLKDHEELRKSILAVQMDRQLDETTEIDAQQKSFYEQGFQ